MAPSTLTIRVLLQMMVTLLVHSQDDDFYRLVYNVTEEQEPGIFVGNTALDTGLFNSGSSQDFQDLRFKLFDQGNDKAKYFSVDEQNGVVRTKLRIDRESVCGNNVDCTMILDIAVYRKTSQQGSFDFYRSIQMVVRVEDKNDNAPKFPQKVVTLSVPENMPAPYRLYTSVASDPDSVGPNSEITYYFETASELFGLEVAENEENGLTDLIVQVNEMLDREAEDSYYVRIVASDNGSPRMSGSVLINIAVTDRNDNAPIFMSTNYTINVEEDASTHEPILTVSAVDTDINDNGQILYKLSSRVGQEIRDQFEIGEMDGKISLTRPVDYEREKKFVFLIEARDRGDPPQSSSAYVVVNILDVNDNAPEITLNLSPEGTDILEHEAPGKFMGHISVSDEDSGVFGSVVCEIDDPNFRLEPFGGQPDVYKIILARSLDHEDLPQRKVTIRCHDSDTNPLLALKSFEVKVIDINDNTPIFKNPSFTGYIPENQPPGTNIMMQDNADIDDSSSLLRVFAEDLDGGELGRVTYTIPVNTNFSVDPVTGILSTLVTFDREVQEQYTFPIVAQDHGDEARSATATVVIHIVDQNDHPPHFSQPIFFLEIQENMPPGSTCGRIKAVDEDSGVNARMMYAIIPDEDSSRFFSVDSTTGDVTSNQVFDREMRDSYTFFMEVQNPSVSYYKDSAQVMVSVLDDNDHAPVITNPTPANGTLTLPNNTTVGSLILKVRAEDGDGPDNTDFEYTIAGSDSSSLFQVITVTGELILAREIRYEDAKTHRVLLVVSDGGSKPQSATATLLISIPAEGLRASPAGANLLTEPNFIIIVIIVVVTLLVAMMVVTVICCIFRRDKKRRAGRHQQRQVKDKMYQAAQWVSTHSLPPGGESNDLSPPHQTLRRGGGGSGSPPEGGLEKKGKKEVSFSLEEEDLEKEGDEGEVGGRDLVDTSGSLGSGSVFATTTTTTCSLPIPATQDNNNLKSPMDGQFLTFTSGKTSPGCRSSPSCYESSDAGHTYANTPPIAETDDRIHMQLDKPGGEDALSASSGETGTDSGRGGSEDEAHTHRGSSVDSDPRSFHPSQSQGGSGYMSFTGTDRGRRKPPSLSSLPEEHHHHHHHSSSLLQPQLSYYRASSEQLPTAHGLGYPPGGSRSYSFNPARDSARDSGSREVKDGYHSMDRKGGEGPYRMMRGDSGMGQQQQQQQQAGGRRTFHTFGPQHQQNQNQNQQTHPAWRRAKGLDGGWRSAATSPTTYTNDDETTTSGSYSLTPEDPPAPDTGEVPFHQVHDIMV
ncbi:protocadherin-1-like isoform X2 [Babylonia areolata]|uniref:protocadherin-1-like isoform X2 n=1 Tax=Babylonia areolata TaxID=304850 RepID=UPI003FD10B09